MGRTAARPAASRRTSTAPRAARRVSGPIRPGHPRPITAVPPRVRVEAPGVAGLPSTGAVARLRALPDHRLLDTLLRSRAWIWILGIALGGIVAMQVSLLKMNAGIGTAVATSTELEHQNATLEEQVAELSSGDRISQAAAGLGLITPDAGAVGYLTVRPGVDPARAAKNMVAPSEAARQLLASGGHPNVLPGTTATTAATTDTATTTTAPAATTTTTAPPAEATTPAPAPTATAPVATATAAPVTTTEQAAPATTTAGAAAAPTE